MKKTRSIQILCSLLVGIIFMLAIVVGLTVYELLQDRSDMVLTITTADLTAEYDGTPLTNHQWQLTGGNLQDGHRIVAEFTGSQTDAGQSPNFVTIKVLDEMQKDVTDQYDITLQYGTLTVTQRSLKIDELLDLSDMTPSNGKYTLFSDDIDLVDGHYAVITVQQGEGAIGDPAETIQNITVFDENGIDVSHNYDLYAKDYEYIMSETGSISTMLDSGSYLEENRTIYSVYCDISTLLYLRSKSCGDYTGTGWMDAPVYHELDGHTYAASYLTSFYLQQINAPTHTVEIIPYIPDYALPYYTAPRNPDCALQQDDTVNRGPQGQLYTVDFFLYDGTTLRPQSSSNNYELAYRQFVYNNYLNMDAQTRDFMNKIIQKERFSKDDPEIISLVATYIQQAATYNLDYDRGLDSAPNNAIAFLSQYREGVCRHYATAATLLFRALGIPARYTVGAVADTQANQWTLVSSQQAHAWTEVYIDGIGWIPVEVTGGPSEGFGPHGGGPMSNLPKELNLKPATVSKRYDGSPLYPSSSLIGFEELEKMGYYYHISLSGSRTEVGVSESIIDHITIFDSQGNDVTNAFDIHTEPGRIHVYLYTISLKSNSVSQIYNGQPCNLVVSVASGRLQSDHSLHTASTASKHVGIQDNSFDVRITDAQGNDQTDLYLIEKIFGTATITPGSLTLQAGDASKVYDGTALNCDKYSIVGGELIPGDTIAEVSIIGSQTEIGRSENMILSVVILDADGEDVSANYIIKYLPGQLRVTAS